MLYRDLKPILADSVVEVTLTKDSIPVSNYKILGDPVERRLLDEIFENDPISDLKDFNVIAIYNVKGGFALEFEFSPELARICSGLGELFLRV